MSDEIINQVPQLQQTLDDLYGDDPYKRAVAVQTFANIAAEALASDDGKWDALFDSPTVAGALRDASVEAGLAPAEIDDPFEFLDPETARAYVQEHIEYLAAPQREAEAEQYEQARSWAIHDHRIPEWAAEDLDEYVVAHAGDITAAAAQLKDDQGPPATLEEACKDFMSPANIAWRRENGPDGHRLERPVPTNDYDIFDAVAASITPAPDGDSNG
jgi:hypothetical protein